MDIENRFWAKVDVRSKNECWTWKGGISNNYGMFRMDGKMIQAHRAVWIILNGSIPDGYYVCHSCDNPPCVNPDHLFLGTQYDNIHDAIDKGRINQSGENAPWAKLTQAQVDEIRRLYIPYKVSLSRLAWMFGTSKTNIFSIVKFNSWRSE